MAELPLWHRLLFPKKAGDALEQALPDVVEVYGTSAAEVAGFDAKKAATFKKPVGKRAQLRGKLLHISYHSLPRDGRGGLKVSVLLAAVLVWLLFYSPPTKFRCVLCALGYSFAELIFTLVERHTAYTSAAQFIANLFYVPVLLDVYGAIFEPHPLLYVLLFPLNIWLLELVCGAAIVWFYGHNVAWNYLDYSDELANGCIRLGHGFFWLGLGLFCLFFYPVLRDVSVSLVG